MGTPPAAARFYGVIYAEDFDAAVPLGDAESPEPDVIEPSFTLAEVEAARAAALEAGALAERERLVVEGATARIRALNALVTALANAGEAARIAAEDAAEGVAQAVLSVVAAGLPALCARHGEREARALLRGLLPSLNAEPSITVRLNPHLLDAVRADLAGLDPELAGAVRLVPTDAMPPGDVRVSWEGGSCHRSADAACAAVREALAPLGLLLAEHRPDSTRTLEIADVR